MFKPIKQIDLPFGRVGVTFEDGREEYLFEVFLRILEANLEEAGKTKNAKHISTAVGMFLVFMHPCPYPAISWEVAGGRGPYLSFSFLINFIFYA